MVIVDLTLTYDSSIPGFDKTVNKTLIDDGWNASTLNFYSHCGTHMDAPAHFNVSNQTIDQIPVSECVGNAWVIDIRHKKDKELIHPEDIPEDIVKKFKPGDSLIFWSDWSQYVGTLRYKNELPRISEALAQWCLAQKVKMIAVEPPSVADVNNLEEVTLIHQILLQGVIIIEGITNIGSLQNNYVELIALPLKISGGDGSPARVIAIEKDI